MDLQTIEDACRTACETIGLFTSPSPLMAYSMWQTWNTSIALRDAIAGTGIPAIEVHISDIRKREAFRRKSITAGACAGLIRGRGFPGYVLALRRLTAR